ncbi:stage II sporulation protein B [Evansella caseinilytica]|uniref:Stage II sporulation protein B n=1 Tax=Evansella caseinilytica TaxID=1503961 RepID=A0A1H3PSY6_9BACI|nr:hypothetical protein [Evansella caseinilytica]SDZ04068.1 stage II sporulation protein B [Evansella caseinilytica]
MRKKRSVSIRLNGKEKTYREQVSPLHHKKPHQKTEAHQDELAAAGEPVIEAWFEKNETGEANRGFSKKIVDFGAEQKKKSSRALPFWDDGRRDKAPKLPPYKRKKRGQSRFSTNIFFNPIFLSVVAAMIVGGAFGMVLLHIFTGDNTGASGGEPGQGSLIVGDSLSAPPEENAVAMVEIPSLSLEVVQGGAFSTPERGKEEADMYRKNGYPAVLTGTGELTYLFIGVSSTRELAKTVGEIYEENGVEPYVKTYAVDGNGGQVAEYWQGFLEKGISWLEKAAYISSQDIAGQTLATAEMDEMFQAGKEWKAAFSELEEKAGDKELELAQTWLDHGKLASEGYASTAASSDFAWEVQGDVLKALIDYEILIENLMKNK